MPITISAAMAAHIKQEHTTLATLWEITRVDGTIFRYTDHDVKIVFGGNEYLAGVGYDRSAIEDKADLSPDNTDVKGILNASADITRTDIRAGLFDGAEVYLTIVNWASPDDGSLIRRRGWFGEVKQNDLGQFDTELRGLSQALSETITKLFTPGCTVDLGSTECGIPLGGATERLDDTEYYIGDWVSIAELPIWCFKSHRLG